MAQATLTAKTVIVIVVAVAAVLGVAGTASAVLLWSSEIVDDPSHFVGLDATAAALDASGRPHIVYSEQRRNDTDTLRYARKTESGAWTIESVDDANSLRGLSMVLDAGDTPHVTYYRNGDLVYAKRTCQVVDIINLTLCGWQRMTVENMEPSLGGNTSLALDASGTLHVSYLNLDQLQLRWARLLSSGWEIFSVTQFQFVSTIGRISLAVDAGGFPHIGFSDNMNIGQSTVKYAKITCYAILFCGWTFETVDTGTIGTLKLDGSGKAHVSYWNWNGTSSVKYAARACVGSGSKASCSWRTETVALGASPAPSALVLDSTGAPRVGYFHDGVVHQEVWYAIKSYGVWSSQLVDSDRSVNGINFPAVSVVLDSTGYPHMAYPTFLPNQMEVANALKYVRGTLPHPDIVGTSGTLLP